MNDPTAPLSNAIEMIDLRHKVKDLQSRLDAVCQELHDVTAARYEAQRRLDTALKKISEYEALHLDVSRTASEWSAAYGGQACQLEGVRLALAEAFERGWVDEAEADWSRDEGTIARIRDAIDPRNPKGAASPVVEKQSTE